MAEDDRSRREASSQAALDEAEEKTASRLITGTAGEGARRTSRRDGVADGRPSLRTVHGRIFELQGRGMDGSEPPGSDARIVEIEPFSAAYFDLLDAHAGAEARCSAQFRDRAGRGRRIGQRTDRHRRRVRESR